MSTARENQYNQSIHVAEIKVGIADLKVGLRPDRLITFSLGSCVGVSLYDPSTGVGGLLHFMLPDSTQFKSVSNPAKFGDLGILKLFNEVRRKGARVPTLQAKLAGGAQMFIGSNEKLMLDIGKRNAAMAKQVLNKLRIKIVAEELGGNRGRTMILDTVNGNVYIRMAGSKLLTI